MIEPSRLPLPEWVFRALDRLPLDEVLHHRVDVDRQWWLQRLTDEGFAEELFEAPEGCLSREALFRLGRSAGHSPEDARRLLWASLSWGTGMRQRNNRSRIRAIAGDSDGFGKLLAEAALLSRGGAPAEAYRLLRPFRNSVPYLGPPFFTKYLYFAGTRQLEHGCLILDSRVARTLRMHCDWASLIGWYAWPAESYERYVALAHRWAGAAQKRFGAEDRLRPVWADEIEYVLFKGPGHFEDRAEAEDPS